MLLDVFSNYILFHIAHNLSDILFTIWKATICFCSLICFDMFFSYLLYGNVPVFFCVAIKYECLLGYLKYMTRMRFKTNSYVYGFCEAAGQHLMCSCGAYIFSFAVQEYVILNGLEMAGTE